jgi:hypothetical protein
MDADETSSSTHYADKITHFFKTVNDNSFKLDGFVFLSYNKSIFLNGSVANEAVPCGSLL